MRILLSFLLAFAVVSVLPIIWNQLTFREIGFPFTYLHQKTIVSDFGSAFSLSFVRMHFLYDAVIVAGVIRLFYYIRKKQTHNIRNA